MCGILFTTRFETTTTCHDFDRFRAMAEKLRAANTFRGPDAQGSCRISLPSSDPGMVCAIDFFVAELQLRGSAGVVQPHERMGDILCWNGEIFKGIDIPPEINDGAWLADALHDLESDEDAINLLGRIEGPYAFVLYRTRTRKLFFGLDPLGRRSLLAHKPSVANPYFLLSSVSVGFGVDYEFEEVSTNAIYCIDIGTLSSLNHVADAFHSCVTVVPRVRADAQLFLDSIYVRPIEVNPDIPPEEFPCLESLDHIPAYLAQPVGDLLSHLDASVRLRVRDIPYRSNLEGQARVAVLFSGGIDSTVLTLLVHRNLPIDEPIDLLNVAFENPRKSTGLQGDNKLPRKQKKTCIGKHDTADFHAPDGRSAAVTYEVPDRVTGLQGLAELKRLCPGRKWNFVEINVPYEESQAARSVIEELMWPRCTVMDFSLAMALYFASRGRGQLGGTQPVKLYNSDARVLLSGLGADELLGGYGRHRTAYEAGGWRAVVKELQLELDRIPTRNLGRDDRVISSHGKEVRQPFLSLDIVSFLARLPVHYKSDPRLAAGVGDKMLLRLAARKLGLAEASERKKRAMQFGSHSARMRSGETERRGDLLLS